MGSELCGGLGVVVLGGGLGVRARRPIDVDIAIFGACRLGGSEVGARRLGARRLKAFIVNLD